MAADLQPIGGNLESSFELAGRSVIHVGVGGDGMLTRIQDLQRQTDIRIGMPYSYRVFRIVDIPPYRAAMRSARSVLVNRVSRARRAPSATIGSGSLVSLSRVACARRRCDAVPS